MDWIRVRRRLAQLRVEQRREKDGRSWSLDDLAKASGVDKSAIHRTENTLRYPDYKPDLDTIERWVRATSPRPLSAFFASFEGPVDPSENPAPDHDFRLKPVTTPRDDPGASNPSAEAAHGPVVPVALLEELLLASVERIVTAVDRLSDRVAARDEQIPSGRTEASRRRQRDRAQHRKSAQ